MVDKGLMYTSIPTEAKSQTIRRMQSNLEEWDKQLQEICEKKTKNGQSQTALLYCAMHAISELHGTVGD